MRELLRVVAGFLALTLVIYPFTLTGVTRGYVALSVPVVLLAGSGLLLWSEGALTLAAAALLGPYVAVLAAEDRPVDVLAPVAAALLAVFVVVSDTAIAVPPGTPVELRFVRELAARCATVAVIAVIAGAALLAASAVPIPDSQPTRSVGIVAAALALAAPVWLLTTRAEPRRNRRKRLRLRP